MQPEDIERVLAAHPQITQAFVVPVVDAEFGQRPVAVIDGDPTLSLATLLARRRISSPISNARRHCFRCLTS